MTQLGSIGPDYPPDKDRKGQAYELVGWIFVFAVVLLIAWYVTDRWIYPAWLSR